jgi:hypothetical protein
VAVHRNEVDARCHTTVIHVANEGWPVAV